MHTLRLISRALEERFLELCRVRASGLDPESFEGAEEFVSGVRGLLLNASPASLKSPSPAPSAWMEAEGDCLSNLRALALGQELKTRPVEHAPAQSFVKELDEDRRDPSRRFRLLSERYSYPFSFALPAEDASREYVLARLMSQDRARAESAPPADAYADDLLLKLNLVAVYARAAADLRFMDALNYYYELLPADWRPRARHNWLLASYYALYARALAARI